MFTRDNVEKTNADYKRLRGEQTRIARPANSEEDFKKAIAFVQHCQSGIS